MDGGGVIPFDKLVPDDVIGSVGDAEHHSFRDPGRETGEHAALLEEEETAADMATLEEAGCRQVDQLQGIDEIVLSAARPGRIPSVDLALGELGLHRRGQASHGEKQEDNFAHKDDPFAFSRFIEYSEMAPQSQR